MLNWNPTNKCDQNLNQCKFSKIKQLMFFSIFYALFIITMQLLLNRYLSDNPDPFFENQWSLKHLSSGINAQKMWDYGEKLKQERSVTIAIIDTGVDFNNKELTNRMWPSDNDKVDYDSYHGTMCAEIITANHNNYGIEGIASFLDLKIMSLKALSSQYSIGGGNIKSVIHAIKSAERNGADICNLSLGTDIHSPELYNTIRNSDMLFVTSSGNATTFRGANIDKKPYYPACFDFDNLISVTSTDQSGNLSTLANYGQHSIDLAAPGDNIPVIQANDDLIFVSGTSFAAPHVTGVAAVLYAFDKNLTPYQCKKYICDTVQTKESLYGKCKTSGIIDGYSALKTLIQYKNGGDES